MSALLLAVLAQFATDVFENDAAFTEVERSSTGVVSQRAVKGSVFREYRVEVLTDVPVARLCSAVFDFGSGGEAPGVVSHKLLADEGEQRVVYNQVAVPVVSNRDYAYTLRRDAALPGGACRIRFRTTNDRAPAAPEGVVRMEKLWGEWRFEPQADGQTKLTYTVFSDPSGSVPAFLVHGGQLKSTKETVPLALRKAKQSMEKPR